MLKIEDSRGTRRRVMWRWRDVSKSLLISAGLTLGLATWLEWMWCRQIAHFGLRGNRGVITFFVICAGVYASLVIGQCFAFIVGAVATISNRRRTRGECGCCGYDLRGTEAEPDGCRVCAECGAAWRPLPTKW